MCRGYWGRPEGNDADGWFATGDLVSVADDGYVTIRGRRTELIITGGHNVYPAEVEAVLARHPGVREVAVVGVPSAEWGETVVAFVVGDPDLDSLDDLATRELAPFKRPTRVHIVEDLPRNALGKVVRGDLPVTLIRAAIWMRPWGSVTPWRRFSCCRPWGRTVRRP